MTAFEGRVAIVTGAAQGIGRAAAALLLERGARVLLADIDGERAAQTAFELAPDGERALARTVDVAHQDEVEGMVGGCLKRFGRLDVLVAVAGVTDFRPLLETDLEIWRRVLEVNLTGALHCTRAAARAMGESGGGAIVLIGSTNAFWVEGRAAAYNASKAGLVGFAKTAALELAPLGIRVNVVHPGIVRTRLSAFVTEDPANAAEVLSRIPLGRFADPEDIAPVIAFLAADDARYVTGEALTADAGMTIGVPFPLPQEGAVPSAGGEG